jgi:hypothetical protein
LFCIEVEQGAVECIAGSRGRHRRLQRLPIQAAASKSVDDGIRHAKDRLKRCFRRLAITGIGNALAAAGRVTVGYFRHHHDRLGLGAAADRKVAFNRPTFDSRVQRWYFAGSHFNI